MSQTEQEKAKRAAEIRKQAKKAGTHKTTVEKKQQTVNSK